MDDDQQETGSPFAGCLVFILLVVGALTIAWNTVGR